MNYKGITLLQIEYFLAVAKYLNFTEASKRLYTSQPSLSRQIARLEELLGVTLFYRTRRDVRLTAAGVVLHNEINGLTEQIESSLKKCMELSIDQNTSLRIGFHMTMDLSIYLNGLIQAFQEKYDQIELFFEKHNFKALRDKLENGSLDIVFTLSFEEDKSEEIVWTKVKELEGCILTSIDNPLSKRERITFKDLEHEIFIVLDKEVLPNAYDLIIAECKNNNFMPQKVIEMPNVDSILLAVESNRGISILDKHVRLYRKEKFKRFPIANHPISVIIGWKKTNMNPAVSMMNNFIMNNT